jgi:hypothetical protein
MPNQTQAVQESRPPGPGKSTFWDGVGIAVSLLCLLHCLALPFVVSLLPLLSLKFLADERAHQWLVGGIALVSLLAFIPGYRKHRQRRVVGLMAGGLSLLFVAAFAGEEMLGEGWERPLTVMGGLVMASAHWLNRTCFRRHGAHRHPSPPVAAAIDGSAAIAPEETGMTRR